MKAGAEIVDELMIKEIEKEVDRIKVGSVPLICVLFSFEEFFFLAKLFL